MSQNKLKVVRVKWKAAELSLGDTWTDLYPRLETHLLTEEQLQKCVYIIRVNGQFAIEYPHGISPVIYIGQGNLKNRIKNHLKWMEGLRELVHEFTFQVCVCVPIDKADVKIRLDMEAALIHKFSETFGSIPLRNQKIEYERENYWYLPESEFKKPLSIGSGKRFLWSIQPMKANKYSRLFGKKVNID